MTVVVVESPAKAKTINKYLGKDFKVLASYGHVRDLPPKDGSVRPDADFEMDWEVDGKSAKRLSDIAAALKTDDRLILATDPDREGEAISWHVLEVLRRKGALKGKAVQRVVFNAITKSSVLEAMQNPREVDGALIGLEPGRAMYAIYVSTTPNPTSGYVFFVDVADVKILDMSVEDGLKLVISMGLIFPEKPLPPEKEMQAARTPSPRPS